MNRGYSFMLPGSKDSPRRPADGLGAAGAPPAAAAPKAHDQAPRRVACLQAWVLLSGWLLSSFAYSFRLESFLHAKDTAVFVSLAAACAAGLCTGAAPWPGFKAWAPAWGLLASALAASFFIRPVAVPSATVETLLRAALLLLAAALAYPALQQRIWRVRFVAAYCSAAVGAACIALCQWSGLLEPLFPHDVNPQRMYALFGNGHLLAGWLLLSLPFWARWSRLAGPRGSLAAAALLPVLLGIMLSGTRTVWLLSPLALAWGLLSGRGGRRRGAGRLALILAMGGVLALALDTGFIWQRLRSALSGTSTGIGIRLWLWDGALRMVHEHPAAGVGPGNFAYYAPRFLGEALYAPGGARHTHNDIDVFFAHCEPLHLAAEMGLLGLAFAVWMAVRLLRRSGLARAPVALWLLYGLTSFPWASASHALAGLFFGNMLLARGGGLACPKKERPANRPAGVFVYACAILACAFYLWAAVWPGALAREGSRAFLAGDAQGALAAYRRAAAHPWPQYPASRDYGLVLLAEGDYARGSAQLVRALEGLDNGPLHAALGAACQLLGQEDRARKHLEAAVRRTPGNADAWTRLMRISTPEDHPALLRRAGPWLARREWEELRRQAESLGKPPCVPGPLRVPASTRVLHPKNPQR